MGDTDDSQLLEMPPQRLVLQNQTNPSKFNSHFLYKALSVAIVLAILPLFPSQAPEFINQTLFTRSWELLHLLFVGIAVSYGLFSRRNVETEKENQNQLKTDTTQTYISRILQVSSVFDDEVEDSFGSDENKAHTWNSKYFRRNPIVVVEQNNPVIDEQSATVSSNVSNNRPLFFPVRSLRSSVSDSDSVESFDESINASSLLNRSASGSKRGSSGREFGDFDHSLLEEKLKEIVVLPSPIPWRSRSGRLEIKEDIDDVNPPPYSLPPTAHESDFDHPEFQSFFSPVHHSSQSNSSSPSPNKLSPSSPLSPELRSKNMEDNGKKKKNGYKSCPPPPPPPPLPPRRSQRSPSILANSRSNVVKKSSSDESKDMSRGTDFEMNYLRSEPKQKNQFEASLVGKSVRTIRGNEPVEEAKKYREFEDRTDGRSGNLTRRKSGGFNQQWVSAENQDGEIPNPIPKPTLPKYQKKAEKKLAQKVILESEEYSSEEADESQGSSDAEQAVYNSVTDARRDPNEVDKKADEFIAKFREQIRLQRIESIKRSSGQHR